MSEFDFFKNMSVYGDTYGMTQEEIDAAKENSDTTGIAEILLPTIPQLVAPMYTNPNENDRGLQKKKVDLQFENIYEDEDRFFSPDLELENMYEDNDRFRDIETEKKKMSIMGILGMLPTPINLAKQGIKYLNDKLAEKKAKEILEKMEEERIKNEEKAAMERVREQQAIDEANYRRQQRITTPREGERDSPQDRQGEREQAGPGYSGSGTAAEMGSFAKGGRIGYGKGGIVTL